MAGAEGGDQLTQRYGSKLNEGEEGRLSVESMLSRASVGKAGARAAARMGGGLGGVGDGGAENDGMNSPRSKRGSLKNGVLATSVENHKGGLGRAGGQWSPHPACLPSCIQAMGIKTALPAAELGLYSLVLSGALAYAGRGLLEASQGNSWALGRGMGPFFPWGASGFQPAKPETQRLQTQGFLSALGAGLHQVWSQGDTDAGTLTETWTQSQRERHTHTQTLRETWAQILSETQGEAEEERAPKAGVSLL